VTWEEFVLAYGRQIGGVARLLLARWKLPAAVSQADIEQEVWLGAWEAWQRWTAGRGGMTRNAFALCSGKQAAMRWIHVQRNSTRRLGTTPGRFPLAETGLLADWEDALPESVVDRRVIEPGQDIAVAFGEAVRDALQSCRTRRERRALTTLVERGFAEGAEHAREMVVRAWQAKEESA
jgi:hypothetical protein